MLSRLLFELCRHFFEYAFQAGNMLLHKRPQFILKYLDLYVLFEALVDLVFNTTVNLLADAIENIKFDLVFEPVSVSVRGLSTGSELLDLRPAILAIRIEDCSVILNICPARLLREDKRMNLLLRRGPALLLQRTGVLAPVVAV